MNYTSAAVGVVMLVALITWLTTARKSFRCPGLGEEVVLHSAPCVEAEQEAEIVREEKVLREGY